MRNNEIASNPIVTLIFTNGISNGSFINWNPNVFLSYVIHENNEETKVIGDVHNETRYNFLNSDVGMNISVNAPNNGKKKMK